MAHLAVAVSGKAYTYELAPAQLIDCSARLGTAAAQVRGVCISSHLAEQGYKGGKEATRKVMLMCLCALRDGRMGTAVRGRSVMD